MTTDTSTRPVRHHPGSHPCPRSAAGTTRVPATAAGVLAALAALAAAGYVAAAPAAGGPSLIRALVLVAAAVLAAMAGSAALRAWELHRTPHPDRQQPGADPDPARAQREAEAALSALGQLRKEVALLAAVMGNCTSELRVLPEAVRGQAGRRPPAYPTVAEEPDETGDALHARLAAIEHRVDDLEEEYERGWVDGATKAAEALGGNGRVRHLRAASRRPR